MVVLFLSHILVFRCLHIFYRVEITTTTTKSLDIDNLVCCLSQASKLHTRLLNRVNLALGWNGPVSQNERITCEDHKMKI